jgi:S1-C subfamily serine protease
VEVATAPETVPRDETTLGGNGPLAGAKVANLSPAVAEELGMDMPPGGGVVIVEAEDATIASRIGFHKGDRILAVNGTHINDVASLVRATHQQNHVWKISIDRGGQRMTQIFQF